MTEKGAFTRGPVLQTEGHGADVLGETVHPLPQTVDHSADPDQCLLGAPRTAVVAPTGPSFLEAFLLPPEQNERFVQDPADALELFQIMVHPRSFLPPGLHRPQGRMHGADGAFPYIRGDRADSVEGGTEPSSPACSTGPNSQACGQARPTEREQCSCF